MSIFERYGGYFLRLENAIEELNKVAANVELLKKKWGAIKILMEYPAAGNWELESKQQYEYASLEFNELLEGIPKIEETEIYYLIPSYDYVSQGGRDANELQEADFFTSFYSEIYEQELNISNYEYVLKRERRKLILNQVENSLNDVDNILDSLKFILRERNLEDELKPAEIDPIRHKILQIDNLMGDSIERPPKWSDLERHLGFGQVVDLNDIILNDWPSIKPALKSAFRGNEPFKINTEDIGNLVESADKSGEIGTGLNWEAITYEQFERLCANLLESLPEWENVDWITPTNASDRGKDISAFWVVNDVSRGTIRERAIIQCKHRPGTSVSPGDIKTIQNLTLTHGKVDLYIIITSGKFTDQVTQIVDSWNERNLKPKVELWGDWRLEQLLAKHPNIIKTYELR